MFDLMVVADRSVVEGLEQFEIEIAKDDPDYNCLRALVSHTDEARVLSRWTLTPEQRAAVAEGADIYLELITFGMGLQPVRMAVGREVDPDLFRVEYGLPDEKAGEGSD